MVGVLACVGMLALVLPGASWPSDWAAPAVVIKRAVIIACSAVAGQAFVQALVPALRLRFSTGDPSLNEPRNRLPQQFIGPLESLLYPWVVFDVPGAAPTIIGAWLTAKTLGNWPGWQTGPSYDVHIGRRRLYGYLLANAFQIGWGVLAAAALHIAQ